MGDVIKLPAREVASTGFDAISWLRKKLEEDQPEHRAEFIRKRIAILEARARSKD